ncbi:DUF6456 domain-containing protein [Loktanella agnita]|uniref:DUF6456 domain-containing protein n=1 Tax=Loktanella agnita TaxID=287097 RepID=UPI00398A3251
MSARQGLFNPDCLPRWVPDAACHYLAHTETGLSIRAVARATDSHPSTILRQVRRFEGRRDDPLIDAALKSLSVHVVESDDDKRRDSKTMNVECWKSNADQDAVLTQSRIDQEARRVLRRLCEQGAVLAVAREMETAVVVRETESGEQLKTAAVNREIAQAMALKNWISCTQPDSRIVRYFITNTGRAALRRLTAEDENRANGFAEKRSEFNGDVGWDIVAMGGMPQEPSRYHATESPLVGLARRRDRDGQLFLGRDLVTVGERLREDFELSQVELPAIKDWDAIIAGQGDLKDLAGPPASIAARRRVVNALKDLGPGLGDIVLQCCCFLEGLEQTEKKMGWSARSGKIVLRIALQRLMQHYEDTQGRFGPMIG